MLHSRQNNREAGGTSRLCLIKLGIPQLLYACLYAGVAYHNAQEDTKLFNRNRINSYNRIKSGNYRILLRPTVET